MSVFGMNIPTHHARLFITFLWSVPFLYHFLIYLPAEALQKRCQKPDQVPLLPESRERDEKERYFKGMVTIAVRTFFGMFFLSLILICLLITQNFVSAFVVCVNILIIAGWALYRYFSSTRQILVERLQVLKILCALIYWAIVIFVTFIPTWQHLSETTDYLYLKSIGGRFSVNERLMHIYCVGTGSPTIVLEHGFAANMLDWTYLQPRLARGNRVCSYDRPGYGWSQSTRANRDGVTIASELHQLLNVSGVNDDLVLVGHSFGGVIARVFQSLFPSRVKGIVLVDSVNPKRFECDPDIRGIPDHLIGFFRATCTLGAMRLLYYLDLLNHDITTVLETLPLNVSSVYERKIFKCQTFESMYRESENFPKTCSQVPSNPIPTPILVLSAGKGFNHTELVDISTNSTLLVFPEASHYFHADSFYSVNITTSIIQFVSQFSNS